jgi:CheY-like chemotaxis protein
MFDQILCVDDDPVTLMLIKILISKALLTKEIVTASNGAEALLYFQDLLPNENLLKPYPKIILLDINMPIMDGWEFLDTFIKNNLPSIFENTKVFVVSSSIDELDIEKSKTYPIVLDFVTKPLTKEKINMMISKI